MGDICLSFTTARQESEVTGATTAKAGLGKGVISEVISFP